MTVERYRRSARRYHAAVYVLTLLLLATGWWLLAGREGQPGEIGAAAAAGLIPDPVQVRGDRAHGDVELGRDLRIGAALGDQGDQLAFPGAQPPDFGHGALGFRAVVL